MYVYVYECNYILCRDMTTPSAMLQLMAMQQVCIYSGTLSICSLIRLACGLRVSGAKPFHIFPKEKLLSPTCTCTSLTWVCLQRSTLCIIVSLGGKTP